MVYGFCVIVNSIEFAESKNAQSGNAAPATSQPAAPSQPTPQQAVSEDDFTAIPDGVEENLPFN